MNESRINNSNEFNNSRSEEYKIELLKYYKFQLMLKILLEPESPLCCDQRAALVLHQMDNPGLLGLDHLKDLEVIYQDRQRNLDFLEKRIQTEVNKSVNILKNHTKSNIEAFTNKKPEEIKVLELEENRKDLILKLIQLKAKKIKLMRSCADLRISPNQKYAVDILLLEAKDSEVRLKMLREGLKKNLYSTPHAEKAIKEVESYIDTILL